MSVLKNLIGMAHIGIPVNDIEATMTFYKKLGFESKLVTVNTEANERVAFMQLGDLRLELYESRAALMKTGAIDHIAINVRDIEGAFEFISSSGMNNTNDTIHFLPFWDRGVRFFTIEGINKEKIEFSQYM